MRDSSPKTTVRLFAAALLLAGMLLAGAAWSQDDRAIDACHNKESDTDIVDCLETLTAQWDKQLNAAYQAALKTADADAVGPLRASERAWLEFRKQRCYYLGAGPGTIGRVVASDCFMRMTKARAEELIEDAKGLGPG